LEPNARLLAVITNINANFELFRDHPLDGIGDLTLEFCHIDVFSPLLAN